MNYFARNSDDSYEERMAADIAQIRRLRSGDIQNLTIEEQQEDINAVQEIMEKQFGSFDP